MKGIYSTILMLVFAGYSYGQNIFLKTQGQNATVCGDNITFTIEVRNLSSSQTLTNVVVNSKMKPGISFVSETSTPASYQVGSPADNPSFSLGSLAPSTARLITFTAKTDCNLVTYLNDNSIVDGFINNQTKATYSINGVPAPEFTEPNGSESFNISYPVLTLRLNDPDKTKTATRLERVTRQFTITNTGNGRLLASNALLEITRETGLTFISLTGANTTLDNTVANKTTIRFNDFSAIGNFDNFLDPAESITLIETVQVNSCDDLALTSNYFMKWGCQGGICNLSSNNSQDASLVQISTGGSPSMAISMIHGDLSLCQAPTEMIFEFKNARASIDPATDRANRATNLILYINNGHGLFTQLSDFKVLTKTGQWVSITPSAVCCTPINYTFNHTSFTAVPGGVAGLSDIDGNGAFDDLMPQDKVQVKATATINCPTQFTDPKAGNYYEFVNIQSEVRNACGQFTPGDYESYSFSNGYVSSKFTGPTDLVQGQTATYSFELNRDYSPRDLTCPNNTFTSDVSFPSLAYKITQVSWTPAFESAVLLPFVQDPDGTLHVTGGGMSGKYNVTVTLDCTLGSVSSASSVLEWKAYHNCSGTCCTQLIGRESYEIFNHCAGTGTGACFRTASPFSVERTSFGYAEATTGYYFQLPSTKLDRNSPGVRLNAAMETDNIQAVARGSVSSGSFDNAHVEIQYISPVAQNILQFTNGYFIINTGSGAQTYPVITPPTVTQSGASYFFDFAVEGLTSFPTGTTVDLYANFKIQKSSALSPGEVVLQRFRAYHYGVSASTRLGCESFGTTFSIVKNNLQASNHFYQTSYGCNATPLDPRIQLYNNALITVDPFPNEFRPNTRATEIKLKVPKGASYRTGSGNFQIGYSSADQVFLAAPTVVQNSDGSADLTWSSNKLPVFDFFRSNYPLTFQFLLNPTCFKDLGSPVPVPVNIKYTNYEFDEGNAQNLEFLQNHSFTRSIGLLTLQANITQDAFSQTVSWPVTLCEGSQESPPNTWVTFEPPSNVNLLTATQNGVNLEIVQYDPNAPHKRLIKIGRVGNNVCKTIILTASYSSCQENVTAEILLRAGNNCGEYPANPDVTVCSSLNPPVTGKVFIRYKNADLTQAVTKANATSNLCEPIPFQVEILSSGIGDMRSVFSLLNLPQGVSFKAGSASYQLPSGSATWTPLADPTSLSTEGFSGLGWNLSADVLGGGDFINQTKILLKFELEASCSGSFESNYDPGVPVIITAIGKTNCGDLVVRPFQSKIEINGFDLNGNTLVPSVEIDEICRTGFASRVHISITNRETTASKAQDLVVTLPAGLAYIAMEQGAPRPASISITAGITRITWKLNSGILSGQTISGFNFLMNVSDQNLSSVTVETRTFIFGSGVCTTTGEQCSLRATTGLSQLQLTVQQENCYRCQEPVPSFTEVCAARDATVFSTWDQANITVSCVNDDLVITNTGTGAMTDSLMYIAYYRNADQIVENIVVKKFKLANGGSLVIDKQSGTLTISRVEVEQSPFNIHNSGIIVSIAQGTGAYCNRVSYAYLSPTPLTWNFGDGNSATGSSVSHIYQVPNQYNVVLTYCNGRSMTIQYNALDCQILDLELNDKCSNDPQTYRWSVTNPNTVGVEVQYQLLNSPYQGRFIAPPQKDTTFFTPLMKSNNTLQIRWLNERNETQEETEENNREDLCDDDACDDCFSSFTLLEGKEYVLSAWVKEETPQAVITYENVGVVLEFTDEVITNTMEFHASGVIIDGWQRVWSKFVVPDNVAYLTIRLLNEGDNSAYFDDIRIHPFSANIKSFVYDPGSQKLMAELDENNYATFYEYDEEGALIRVKKETERGTKTVQESRNNTVKTSHDQ